MKRLLLLLLLCAGSALAQSPYVRTTFTTNAAPNFFLDGANSRLGIGSSATPPYRLMLAGNGITDGLYVGSGSPGDGNNLQLWQSTADSYLTFGNSTAGGSLYFAWGPNAGATKFLRLRDTGAIEARGTFTVNAVVITNSLTLPYGTASTLLILDSGKAAVSLANGAEGTVLGISNGVPAYIPATGNVTNTYNTINATNVTVQNNLTVSNLYTVNGKHNTLIVTNGLTVVAVGPSKLVRTDFSTNLAAVTVGTGIAFDGTTLSSTALATSGGTATNLSIAGGTVTTTNLTWNTETLSPASGTNFVLDFVAPRTALITATNDVNWLNSTNRTASTATELNKKVRIWASGANRTVTLHSSWILVGSTTRTYTVTNGTYLVMALDNSGASETNVFAGATYAQ